MTHNDIQKQNNNDTNNEALAIIKDIALCIPPILAIIGLSNFVILIITADINIILKILFVTAISLLIVIIIMFIIITIMIISRSRWSCLENSVIKQWIVTINKIFKPSRRFYGVALYILLPLFVVVWLIWRYLDENKIIPPVKVSPPVSVAVPERKKPPENYPKSLSSIPRSQSPPEKRKRLKYDKKVEPPIIPANNIYSPDLIPANNIYSLQ